MSLDISPEFGFVSKNASMYTKGHLGQNFESQVGDPIITGGNSIKLDVGFSPFRT